MNATLFFSLLLSAAMEPARFALIVGYNASIDPAIESLAYADDDAVMTHELLSEAGVDSILLTELDAESADLHHDTSIYAPPTEETFYTALEILFERIRRASTAGRETELLFAYSGHGDTAHGEGFVTLANGKLQRSDLYDRVLAQSPATRNHVIVDACRSYFLVYRRGPGGERTPVPMPTGFAYFGTPYDPLSAWIDLADDAVLANNILAFEVEVLPYIASIVFDTTTLPSAVAGQPYSTSVTAMGAPTITYDEIAPLSPWFEVSSMGEIGGTPPTPGNYSISIRASGNHGYKPTERTFNITAQ